MDAAEARARIVGLAAAEGFDPVRVAPAAPLMGARHAALEAHGDGRLAEMGWMTEEWLVRATEPGRFLDGARSVVMVALPYTGAAPPPDDGVARGRVAAYAQGRDYHRVFERKLRRLARAIREEFGAAARPTVDYGPLLERPLAALAGMGWLGKSTMLLVPGAGPWVLLGAIATDLALPTDAPLKKSCGACTRCIVACPTGALSADGELDARLCISYHTIENRGAIPRELRPKFGAWVFGCDDCLSSCPVGRDQARGSAELAAKSTGDAHPALVELLALTEEGFRARFQGRAIMRAKRDGLVRNACVALGNVGGVAELAALEGTLGDPSALVRGHAAWAIGAIAAREPGAAARALAALRARLSIEGDETARGELAAALAGLEERG